MMEAKNKSIFRNADSVALIFTPANVLLDDAHYEFVDEDFPGCDPAEAFVNDIRCNLIAWACEKKYIAYETVKWRYLAEFTGTEVLITRFAKGSFQRWDTFLNTTAASLGIGKGFLTTKLDKRIARII